MKLQKAARKQVKIKIGLQGPSGAGKTYSALLLAFGLVEDWSKIAVIDCENTSSALYSHLGSFNVLSLSEPYSPERFIEAIEICENAGMKVIIIDTISSEWSGKGGILEIHSNAPGQNSYFNWAAVSPRHSAFIQKMLQSPTHIIATIRSKQDYALSESQGKIKPIKVGLKGIARDDFDYELTVVLNIDIKHNATASKDRSGLFMDKPPFIITEKTGKRIKKWCEAGESLDEIINRIQHIDSVDKLNVFYNQYPDLKSQLYPHLLKRKNELLITENNQ